MSIPAINKKRSEKVSNWRIHVLFFVFFMIATAIVCRFYGLQIIRHAQYEALAKGQHSLFRDLIPKRGEIFMQDKNGLYPAAVNKETKMAYAVPKEIEDPFEAARTISGILQVDEGMLREKFEKSDSMYAVIKNRLSEQEIEEIGKAQLKGIRLSEENYRYYPSAGLAANVIGFVGWKGDNLGGRYGIESFFDDRMRGTEGSLFQKRDASGGWVGIKEKEVTEARDGDTLVLTIDHIAQYQAEKILKGAAKSYGIDGGSIVVMEPGTGRVLVMANYPSFDPNEYAKVEDINFFRNPAVNDAYESGSVFKPFTIAAGLDSGKITPESTYNDIGYVLEAGYTIKNSDEKANGIQTMTQVLEKSLNTGVIHVEKLLGNKNFADYVERFGFGSPTGIELVGESKGNISNLKHLNRDIQFFTAAFGQGITVTPIQLAAAYGAIANGGTLMKPQIIDKMIYPDGKEEKYDSQEVRRVISQKASLETAEILRNVVVNGHGKRADVPGYLVAGKTGTAQVASSEKRGYEEGRTIGSFAGFAPMNDPKFVIIVKLDNPKNVEWAESSAAPAFGEMMKFLLDYYGIEPTEEYEKKDLDNFNRTHALAQVEEEDGEKTGSENNNEEDKKDE